jgi:peroxiredoxin/uncharacterized membrane protein YphA (DoxX/SURF4 family)
LLDTFLLIARIVLAAVFGVAGIAKLADQTGSRKSMSQFGVPAFLVLAAALLLPLLELAVAVALLRASWAWWGSAGALALLSLFVVAIAVNMMLGRKPDCHCFGQLHSSPAGWATLSRNLVLAVIAGFVFRQGPQYVGLNYVVSGFSGSGGAILILALVVVGLVVVGVVVLYHLLRQNGRMLARLEAIEAKLGVVPAQPQPAGLPVNSQAPAFSLADLDNANVSLDMLRASGKPILLFFSEPGCGACDTILPDVGTWQREHAERLVVVPISRGKADANRAKNATHKVQNVLLQRDREVAHMYHVENTPSAVLVNDGRIASPLAVGTDAIRALVKEATMPPPLKKGDRVPSLELRDLGGGTMDLATLGSRRTMLLFWNPSCGFCEKMLDDVKAWERSRAKDAPHLVVISAGSPKANREQGFQSPVLLDSQFITGTRFGAEGTPAAVIVDADGRVGSDVGVGADAVMALANGGPADRLRVPGIAQQSA